MNTIQILVKQEGRKGLFRCLLVQALEANHNRYSLGKLEESSGVN
jgi:hypothetical protein